MRKIKMDNYFFQFVVILLLCKIGIAVGVDESLCNYVLLLSAVVLGALLFIDLTRTFKKE